MEERDITDRKACQATSAMELRDACEIWLVLQSDAGAERRRVEEKKEV
jgi:hypothetical protein